MLSDGCLVFGLNSEQGYLGGRGYGGKGWLEFSGGGYGVGEVGMGGIKGIGEVEDRE